MRNKTICWFIAALKLILFVSFYGKDSIKADEVNALLDSGTDEYNRNKEEAVEIEVAEGVEAKKIIENVVQEAVEAQGAKLETLAWAFRSETGFLPSECELVQRNEPDKIIFFYRKRGTVEL